MIDHEHVCNEFHSIQYGSTTTNGHVMQWATNVWHDNPCLKQPWLAGQLYLLTHHGRTMGPVGPEQSAYFIKVGCRHPDLEERAESAWVQMDAHTAGTWFTIITDNLDSHCRHRQTGRQRKREKRTRHRFCTENHVSATPSHHGVSRGRPAGWIMSCLSSNLPP